MAANGRTDRPPPYYVMYGRVIHAHGVVGGVAPGPADRWTNAELSGECRNIDSTKATAVSAGRSPRSASGS